jgi:hypothetical protein
VGKGAARTIVAREVGTGSGSADSIRRARLRPSGPPERAPPPERLLPPRRLRSGAPSVVSTSTLSTSASAEGRTR